MGKDYDHERFVWKCEDCGVEIDERKHEVNELEIDGVTILLCDSCLEDHEEEQS